MSGRRMRVATTHIDMQRCKLTLGALEGMQEQIRTNIIPIIVNHDPRIPPIGRMIDAEIVQLEDGEYALDAIGEIFEDQSEAVTADDRDLILNKYESNTIGISVDESFQTNEDRKLLNELDQILGTNVPRAEESKRSIDPVAVIEIGGCFLLEAIASGFLSQIGSNLYDVFIEKLTKLTTCKEHESEKILKFNFTVRHSDGREIVSEILLTNPTSKDIDAIIKRGLKQSEKAIASLFSKKNNSIAKVVFDYRDKTLVCNYVLDKKGKVQKK